MVTRKEFLISLPNEPGQLARLCEALSQRAVNIRTIAGIAETPPVLAIIADREEETKQAFQELGLTYKEVELLTVKFNNIPGEIASFARKLAEVGINIESVYMMGEAAGKGMIAFAVSDLDKARQILSEEEPVS